MFARGGRGWWLGGSWEKSSLLTLPGSTTAKTVVNPVQLRLRKSRHRLPLPERIGVLNAAVKVEWYDPVQIQRRYEASETLRAARMDHALTTFALNHTCCTLAGWNSQLEKKVGYKMQHKEKNSGDEK